MSHTLALRWKRAKASAWTSGTARSRGCSPSTVAAASRSAAMRTSLLLLLLPLRAQMRRGEGEHTPSLARSQLCVCVGAGDIFANAHA